MERHDVLCGCGWGQLGMKEENIPHYCPVCDYPLIPYANPLDYSDIDDMMLYNEMDDEIDLLGDNYDL